ncbi:enoyl-CoA hydratase/isomerase family protein [Streptomyces sp. NPDC014983]|uniref:enoyl-CoA hydratase/isomerase family protein n=1 Tax=Streptomyces sp. NPDC014983 TaxID=3364933 RepID=UPI0036FBBB4B
MLNDFKTLRVTEDGHILHVQIDRPAECNSITRQVLDELQAVLTALEEDRNIRVMVLSGAGDHFSAGGDRAEFAPLLSKDPSGRALRSLGLKAQRVCENLARLQVVSIARLQGDVIGAGLGLAAFCHIRIGADNCRFLMPELALGVPPAWGGVLPRLIAEAGHARVRYHLLTSRAFDSATAKEMSLLQEIVPLDELDTAVARCAKLMARRNPAVVEMTVTMMNACQDYPRGSYDADLMTSAATRRAFSRSR